jgi:hypothetical protein
MLSVNRLEQARSIVRDSVSPSVLRKLGALTYYDGTGTRFAAHVTPNDLARSLHYVVELRTTAVADESAAPLGASKYCGLPHLPPGFSWPAGQYFTAQVNLDEFHPHDLHDVFPARGMMYLFLSMSTADVTLVHHDGPLDGLRVTPYPDGSTFRDARHHLSTFRDRPALLGFEPHGVFLVGTDISDRSGPRPVLPPELVERIGTTLGSPVTWESSAFNMFGQPVYWQGEDELPGSAGARGGPPRLLFQDEIDDAAIHVWISPADARKRRYDRCWSDSSSS